MNGQLLLVRLFLNQLPRVLPGSEEGLCLNAHERGPAPLVLQARRAPAHRCLQGHGCTAQAQEAAALRVAPPGSLQRHRRGVQAPQARAGGKPAERALDCHRSLAQTAAGSASKCLLNLAQCSTLCMWLIISAHEVCVHAGMQSQTCLVSSLKLYMI